MSRPNLVRVHQNGDSGPVVEVSEAFAKNLGLTPLDSDAPTQPKSPKRSARRAGSPSHKSGASPEVASSPEEADK